MIESREVIEIIALAAAAAFLTRKAKNPRMARKLCIIPGIVLLLGTKLLGILP